LVHNGLTALTVHGRVREHQILTRREEDLLVLECEACGVLGRIPGRGHDWVDPFNAFLAEHRDCRVPDRLWVVNEDDDQR
jgi:hypothetical protein